MRFAQEVKPASWLDDSFGFYYHFYFHFNFRNFSH